jgi:hypothetical protein
MTHYEELCLGSPSSSCQSTFNEDEILNRFKVIPHDIGDKVISLSEDVLVTCNNWRHPKSNVHKLEEAVNDPLKKHLVFYDMWSDEIVDEILGLFNKFQGRVWSSIEFRGCQEKHINAVLRSALEKDVVQTIAFSLTTDRFDPSRRGGSSTFDVIASAMENNRRLECLIFHSRPIHFLQYESLKKLMIKRLHFLEGIYFNPHEIPELAAGLEANTSLVSFSFLAGITNVTEANDVSRIVRALKSHPSLQRLSLCLKSCLVEGVKGIDELLASDGSVLECVTLTGGFALNSFFQEGTFSRGLKHSSIKHLHMRDIFLSPSDVQDLAEGLYNNRSIESFSLKLDASDVPIDVSPIAFALQDNQKIQRLSLAGRCNLGTGVYAVAKLLSSEYSSLKDLHLSGAFLEKLSRIHCFLEVLTGGLQGNKRIESLDLSVNDLSDADVTKIYNVIWTCNKLDNLDLGMNDVSPNILKLLVQQRQPSYLGVLRISSPRFSFFQINDQLCRSLLDLLTINPRLGDVNFNMGPVEWHQTYHNGEMRWHHFFPAYRVYALHSNNKRVEYLKNKALNPAGRADLERVQFLLDYNWAGRCLISHHIHLPLALWSRVLERINKGRTCFWTGRDQGSSIEFARDATFSFLRHHVSPFLTTATHPQRAVKRRRFKLGVHGEKRKR